MSNNTPLPEPLPLPTLTKAAGGCYMGKYDLHQLTSVEFQRALDAHAAAVSAAKDARIKVLEDALRMALAELDELPVWSNTGHVCNIARAALGDKAPNAGDKRGA